MKRFRKRRCRHCHDFFLPDYRNVGKQGFCSKPLCQKASKAESQRKWRGKNPGYFRGDFHVKRVQQWRREHPGYHYRKSSSTRLQDDCSPTNTQKQDVGEQFAAVPQPAPTVLQDDCLAQHPVIYGLIMQITGLVLQDDIAAVIKRLAQSGHDALKGPTQTKGGHYDPQIPHLPRPHPQDPGTIQLGGSPSGP